MQAAARAGEGLAYRNAAVDARDGAIAASQNAGVAASTAQISKVSTFPSRLDTDGSNFTTGANMPVGTVTPLPASRYENVAGFGLVGTASDGAAIYHSAPKDFRAGRVYRARVRVEVVAPTAQNVRPLVRCLTGAFEAATTIFGHLVSVPPGVVTELTLLYGDPAPAGGSAAPANTVWTRAGTQSGGAISGGKLRVYEVFHEDVTESVSAANSAASALTQSASASAAASEARLAANLAASVSSRSGNLLSNTDFAATTGWTANVPLNINGGPSGYHPLGERVLTVTHATAQVDVYSSRASVEEGKWYEVSAYLLAHRSQVKLFIRWINAAGAYITSPETAWTTTGGGGNSTLADYTRLWLKAKAPVGAVAAVLMARKSTTQSGSDSWMWMARPMLAETSETATAPALYTVGSGRDVLPAIEAQASMALSASVDALTQLGQAAFELILASGNIPAYIKALAEPGGSEIAFAATKLLLRNVVGDQIVTALELINGEAYFGAPVSVDISGRRLTIGPGFGVSNGLVLWFGPNTIALSAMSRTNGYFALGTDGRVYYGNAELGGSGKTSGVRTFSSGPGGSAVQTTISGVQAGSQIGVNINVNGGSLSDNSNSHGSVRLYETAGGNTRLLFGEAVVTVPNGLQNPNGSWGVQEEPAAFGTVMGQLSGDVTYRAEYSRSSGSSYVEGAVINASVTITPPL